MKSTRGHAAQASGKHAVHLEVDGPGATPRAAPCLSFSFARLWHFIFILILFDLIRTLSAVSTFERRAPEHGPSGWPPYRRSLVGRALLPLLLSPTMFVAATSSPRAPDVLLVFFATGTITFHLHLMLESLDSAPQAFIATLDYKMCPCAGLTMLSDFLSSSLVV